MAALWQQQLGALLDMWRQRRPTAVQYTRFGRNNPPSAARLDRFYTSPQLADYVCQVGAARDPILFTPTQYLSDHRPVSLSLQPAAPVERWCTPVRRVRLMFVDSLQHRAAFEQQLQQLAAQAPADDAELLAWWPAFKQQIARAAGITYADYRRSSNYPTAAPAGARLQQLYAAAESGDEAQRAAAIDSLAAATAEVRRAAQADEEARRLRERREWLHHREYPHPGLTRRLRPPVAQLGVAGLRAPMGCWPAPHLPSPGWL